MYIGDASRVPGARPDIAAKFPTAAQKDRAGWGYLLLSLFLPNLGNGTFTLYAYADDGDGHSTLLGTKIITCANAGSLTPFGAIDTPGQGEVVSGVVNNFGWVLDAGTRRADPMGGGTVRVVIDGVPVGVPTGWTSRADLTSLFPRRRLLRYQPGARSVHVRQPHADRWPAHDRLGGDRQHGRHGRRRQPVLHRRERLGLYRGIDGCKHGVRQRHRCRRAGGDDADRRASRLRPGCALAQLPREFGRRGGRPVRGARSHRAVYARRRAGRS